MAGVGNIHVSVLGRHLKVAVPVVVVRITFTDRDEALSKKSGFLPVLTFFRRMRLLWPPV